MSTMWPASGAVMSWTFRPSTSMTTPASLLCGAQQNAQRAGEITKHRCVSVAMFTDAAPGRSSGCGVA